MLCDEDDATCFGTKQQHTNHYVHTSMNNEGEAKCKTTAKTKHCFANEYIA